MSKTKPKIIIIDGNAIVHRSFHALPPTMRTKSGEIVNAVYGFASFLLKAIKEIKPEYIVLTMDKKAPTFRHKMFKEYKAKRIKAPNELYEQIPRIKELANAFDIPIFEMDGFEADDLIGTIAKNINSKIEKIILTGDMDTLQLVNDHTKIYLMSKGITDSVIYDINAIKERFNITPEQIIDYKALRGDPSDNIPGVHGIGEKTAVALLNEFGNLEKIYEHTINNTKQITNKFKLRIIELLKKYKNNAYISQKLATIECQSPIKFNLEKTKFNTFNLEKITNFFSKMGFKSLSPRLQTLNNNQNKLNKNGVQEKSENKFKRNEKKFKYKLIDNEEKFNLFLKKLKKQKEFTFDTETSSIDTLTSSLLGISFSWEEGKAYYVVIKNSNSAINQSHENNLFSYKTAKKLKIKNKKLIKLKPIFENSNIKKCAHNAKFDLKVMQNQKINVNEIEFDTMIASYLLNPGSRQHNLDTVVFNELKFEKINKNDLLGKGKEKKTFSEIETEKLSIYSCEDADFTNRLKKKLKSQLKKEKQEKLFKEIEMPLIPVLAYMENNGVIIDEKILQKMHIKISQEIEKIKSKIYKLSNEIFNITSTKQLNTILFEKLEIPTNQIKKTKTGFSTATNELNKLKNLHPIIPYIQKHRELTKLITTYVDALPKLINKKTGRIHSNFNQTITATGRLSSTKPNLQNIPIKTKIGKDIRKAFIATKGYMLVSLDYSQIELRLIAHMAKDIKMIKAFNDGADIHKTTASEINNIKLEKITNAMRQEAKAINFGILYGQGPHGLSQSANISYASAKTFIDKYFTSYKNIKNFIDTTIEKTKKNGYTETLFHRRRYIPDINSSMIQVRKAAERMAINMPIQGTAADMTKIAMINVYSLIKNNPNIKMLSQIHDELLFEIKNNEIKKNANKIKKIMENAIKLSVPVVVDVKAGDNWGEMKSIKII